jgi:adhesin/invasin
MAISLPRFGFDGLRRVRAVAFAAICALGLSVCGREPTGPGANSAGGIARLMLEPMVPEIQRPLFQVASAAIDNVHLVIRATDGTIVFDKVVQFAPGQNEVTIVADVKVNGESERFTASYELRSGNTALYEGTQDLTARPGVNTTAPTVVPVTFVGPGATSTRVAVTPPANTLLAGASVALSATAFDASNAPISGVLFAWSSSNPAVASVSGTGVVTAGSVRGSATITASTLSAVTGSAGVNVILPATQIAVVSGAGQTGAAGSQLANPLVVQVSAADGVGVGGVSVAFTAVTAGASVGTATAVTDATGRASTTLTLAGAAGAHSFRATAGALTTTASATAVAGPASSVTIVSGNAQADTIGRTLPLPFVVKVVDAFGNVVSGATVTWTRTAGAGSTSAATSVTDAQGATQVTYTLGNTPGAETITATIAATGAGASVTFSATARPRPASNLIVVAGDAQVGVVGTAVTTPLVVRASDNLGNPVSGAIVEWSVAGSARLGGTTSTTDPAGRASMSATFANEAGGATVTARLAATPTATTSFSLTARAGAPAQMGIMAGNGLTAPVGAATATPPSVRVLDAFGNVIAGASVTFAPGSGGAVTGSPATTNALGIASAGTWTLGATAGPQSLVASTGTVSVVFNATATAPVGPSVLSLTTQPSASTPNTLVFAQQPVIQLKNAAGANLSVAGVVVTVAVDPGAPVIREGDAAVAILPALRGTLTATTNASGVATFANLSFLGSAGTYALSFSAGGYTGVVSNGIVLGPGPAVYLTPVTATAINATAGSVVTPNPVAIVKDSSFNPVSGVSVTFATPAPGNGLVTGGGATTNASGNASPTSWTLDNLVGADTMTATSAGLVGSPITFVATTSAGAATQLAIVSGNNQTGITGNPLASPMIVIAKDALNNPVAGVNITFTSMTGGGTPTSSTIASNAGGQASFTLTLGAPGGHTVQACLPSCATAQATFNALAIPVGADAIWVGTTSTNWSTASNWSPAVVPGGANNVFVPSGTPNAPALTASVNVNHLTLASGASLSLATSTVTLGGDLLATGATMTAAGGTVYVCGGTHAFSGGSAMLNVDCGATINVAGTATINGNLFTYNSSVFDVGAGDVTVTGNTGMYSGSRIKMTNAGGKLVVQGNFDSNPGNDVGDSWMTDGVLELKGNLTGQFGCCGQSFRAVGNHLTRFSGSAGQSINFQFSAEGHHRETFGRVEFIGNNTVTLLNHIRSHGAVTVSGTTTLTGGFGILHYGQLTAAAGTNLSGLAYTQLEANGAVFPLIAGVAPPVVHLASGGVVTLPNASVTLPTSLATHSGTVLDLEGKTLVVTGNFGMNSGSRVKMINASSHFLVQGNYTSTPNGDVGDTWMTDGLLEIRGNLAGQFGCCGQSFRAVGNHITRFSGSGAQSIDFQYSAEGYHRETFGRLEFTGNNTVTLLNHVRSFNTIDITGTTTITSPTGKGLISQGQLIAAAGTNLSGIGFTQLEGGGAVFPLIAGAAPPAVYLYGGNTVKLPAASVTLSTNLLIDASAVLDLEGKELIVTGNFTMGGGSRVKMVNPTSHFLVQGNYTSTPNGDIGDTWMTDGLLEIRGNLAGQFGCCGQSFRAVGNHITRFSGSGAQSINFQYSAEGYHRETFGRLEFTGNNTVTLLNHVRSFNTIDITGTTTITSPSGKGLISQGQLIAAAGTNLSGIGFTQLEGGGAVFPLIAGVAPPAAYLYGGITVKLPAASVTLPASLITDAGAVLDLEGKELIVTGNFTMGGGSRVKMINASSHFLVQGNYTSTPNGDLGDTWMTDGLLEIRGNLTGQFGCCGQSFRAIGNHITRFSGTGAQSINFQYSHEGHHRETFGKLEFTGNNTVTLANHVRAWGTVTVTGTTAITGSGKGILPLGQFTSAAGTDLSGLGFLQQEGGGAVFPLIAGIAPPAVWLYGGITVTLPAASVTLSTSLITDNGAVLDLEGKELIVTGNFTMGSGSRVKMVNAASHFLVQGNYTSTPNGDIGDTWMTDGLLELKGNLTGQFGCCGQSFRAVGNHVTRFSGTGAQSISFQYAHEGVHRESFGKVEVTNSSGAGVSTNGGISTHGSFTNLGKFTIVSPHVVNLGGTLFLGPSSTTTNAGILNRNGSPACTVISGSPTISGFSCTP